MLLQLSFSEARAFLGIVQTGVLYVSHPFRRKTRNGWGTEVHSKSENALMNHVFFRANVFLEQTVSL